MRENYVLLILAGCSFTTFSVRGISFNTQTLTISPFNVTNIGVKHFGENCSDTKICDIKETLACINGTCSCADSFMVFDPARGLCVGKAGGRCIRHPTEASVPPSKRIGSCVIYATCETDDFDRKNTSCRCWSSLYPDESTGFCLRRREYLQNCDRDEQCNHRKGFICNKDVGICTCDMSIHRYNPDSERCIGLPNQECANIYRECTENHKCKGGICRCKFKEVEAVNGTLLCDPVRHKFAKPCGRFRGDCGDELVNNLRCLDGKCRCKNPDYQIYDHDRRMCVSKVGGPCTLPHLQPGPLSSSLRNNSKFNPDAFPTVQCISYAQCVPILTNPDFSDRPGICECGQNFIETKKGMCSLPFGADCDTSQKNKKDECDHPLKCVASRCGCPNEVDVYEPQFRKCSKPINSPCWKGSSCVKNAACKQRLKRLPGRCRCSSKFNVTFSATCA